MHPPCSPRVVRTLSLAASLLFGGACGREPEPTGPPVSGPSSKVVPLSARKLAFTGDRNGEDDIYVINASGTGELNLTSSLPSANSFFPVWSPNGKKIAFLRLGHLFVMNPDGSGVVDLTPGLPGVQAQQLVTWSPDGSTIAYVVLAEEPSSALDIYLVHADGSGMVPLTTDGLGNSDPEWSPDGSRIAYVRNQSDGVSPTEDRGIYTVAPNGTGRTQLTADALDATPTWSPSGNQIAFVRDAGSSNGNDEIFVMDANGANQTDISNNPADEEDPSWSPDGSRILFVSIRNASHQIFVMDPDGSDVAQLTASEESRSPKWSPDGALIAFTRRPLAGGDGNIWRMSASGDGETQLTTLGDNSTVTWKGSKQ